MRDIYNSASRVVVWLGQGSRKIMSAFNHLSTISADQKTKISNAHESAFNDLCLNTYWTRIWIIQELVMAAEIVLMYGTAQLEWRNFTYAARQVSLIHYRYRTATVLEIDHLRERLSKCKMVDNTWLHENNLTTFEHRSDRLDLLLLMFRNYKSTDFRDPVYALLGLAVRGFRIDVDYTVNRENLAGRVIKLCQEYNEYSRLATPKNPFLKSHEIWNLLMRDSQSDD
jgi:hypothetical protein